MRKSNAHSIKRQPALGAANIAATIGKSNMRPRALCTSGSLIPQSIYGCRFLPAPQSRRLQSRHKIRQWPLIRPEKCTPIPTHPPAHIWGSNYRGENAATVTKNCISKTRAILLLQTRKPLSPNKRNRRIAMSIQLAFPTPSMSRADAQAAKLSTILASKKT